jgi:conjugative relaxase-like TrwC/TraI family protein
MLSLNYITAGGAADYYDVVAGEELEREISPQERYYAEKSGIWLGRAARYLHLHGQSVTREDFGNVLNGFSPKGQKQLVQAGQNQLHRAGIDWTFSAPKSVSLSAELIFPELKQQIFEAHNRSVTRALHYFENNYAEARQTINYVTETVQTGNLAIATFLERTSRSLDPQLHTHCVIANITKRADGKWRALTNEQLHQQKMFIGQVYRNYLAQELQNLGMAVESKPKGLFEIKGVPQELIETFSTRSEQIRQKLPELRKLYPTAQESVLKAMAAQASRPQKVKVSEEELQQHWQQKLIESGYDKEQLRQQVLSEPKLEAKEINHSDLALDVLTQTESVIKKEAVLSAALGYSIGHKTIEDVEQDFKNSEKKLKMDKELYTTQEMQTLEHDLAAYLKDTTNDQVPLLVRRPSLLLPKDRELSADQERTLLSTLTSRDKVSALQGSAGTGKSLLASVIARNYQRAGYDVLPLSPTALAAAGLREKGLSTANTIDHFLTKPSLRNGRSRLFIVEEASQLGSRKFKQILEQTKRFDRVLLIGDRHQHQSIDAGAIFTKAQQHRLLQTENLRQNIRQQAGPAFLSEVVTNLSEQRVEEAIGLLDRHSRISEVADGDERLKAVVDKYVQAPPDKEPLVITETNGQRQQLNQLIRERLVEQQRVAADGNLISTHQPKNVKLGERNLSFAYQAGDYFFLNSSIGKLNKGSRGEVTAVDHLHNTIEVKVGVNGKLKKMTIDLTNSGHHLSSFSCKEQEFAAGDKIVFLKNQSDIGVQNGLNGTIVDIQKDGTMTVRTADDRILTFNSNDYGFFDYGYSTTSYKVQGSEHSRVIFHADTRNFINFQSFYVATSRAREDIEIITDNKERLFAQVQHEQVKTSTLDYSSPQEQMQQGLGMGLGYSE